LGAPDIRFTGDWYLLAQLKKFKSGQRGTNPKDIKGATMRPMAMTLANEQAMKDVVAYIMTLAKTAK
jgi:cytochrome c553